MNTKQIIVGLLVFGILAMTGVAYAQGQGRRPQNNQGRQGQGQGQRDAARPIYGEIVSIGADSWTIKPMIPEIIEQRRENSDREQRRELPEQIVISVTDKTKYHFDGEQASADSFRVSDIVVVMTKRGNNGPMAVRIADESSAKQFIGSQMGGGQGRQDGQRGQGGPGRQGPRPMFGVITHLSNDSMTITPEVPQFILDIMAERGHEPPSDLPDEITVILGERTHYVVNSEPTEGNPFGVGDHVAIMGGRGPKAPVAAVADYATAEARMEDGPPNDRQGQGGPGQRNGQGKQGNNGNRKGPRR